MCVAQQDHVRDDGLGKKCQSGPQDGSNGAVATGLFVARRMALIGLHEWRRDP
jgi:hypothetical protein